MSKFLFMLRLYFVLKIKVYQNFKKYDKSDKLFYNVKKTSNLYF